jgi:type IV fimbrial biogenesis protein FimT
MVIRSRLARSKRRISRAAGFSLIELMVAVSVLAMLLAIGVPTFQNAALGSRLTASANNLVASIQLARSEAIKRNVTVTVCASADGAACGGGWEQGWIVLDGAGVLIERTAALPAGYVMSQAGGVAPLRFEPIGIGATSATVTVCRDDPAGPQERIVNVAASGTTYVSITNTGVCP